MKKTLKTTVALLSCLIHLWVGLSFAEVITKNVHPNPTYSEYNAIGMFLEYSESKI